MQILSKKVLIDFWQRHPRAETPLKSWYSVAKQAKWQSPQDVKDVFGTTVDFIGDNRIVFDISGNTFRLVARISYPYQRIMIKFVGTHDEYDEIDAETSNDEYSSD